MLFCEYSSDTSRQTIELCEQRWAAFTCMSFSVSVKQGNIWKNMIELKSNSKPPIKMVVDWQTTHKFNIFIICPLVQSSTIDLVNNHKKLKF